MFLTATKTLPRGFDTRKQNFLIICIFFWVTDDWSETKPSAADSNHYVDYIFEAAFVGISISPCGLWCTLVVGVELAPLSLSLSLSEPINLNGVQETTFQNTLQTNRPNLIRPWGSYCSLVEEIISVCW